MPNTISEPDPEENSELIDDPTGGDQMDNEHEPDNQIDANSGPSNVTPPRKPDETSQSVKKTLQGFIFQS